MAWLGSYAYRREITVDNTNIDSDLTFFPVAIVLGTSVGQSSQDVSDIFDEVGSSYLKISVTKSDGSTQIYADVEQWDSVSEKAVVWVSKSDLTITTAATTKLYIYFDSTQSDNTTYIGLSGSTPGQGVWDSNFAAVYHMAQDPSTGGACILDSTSNANHGTPNGSMTSGDLVDADFGKALSFDGVDDYIKSTNNIGIYGSADRTIDVLFKTNSIGTQRLVSWGELLNYSESSLVMNTDTINDFRIAITAGNKIWNSLITDNIQHNISIQLSGGYSGNTNAYLDGSIVAEKSANNQLLNTTDSQLVIGARIEDFATLFSGNICEIRISDIARSAAWIKASKASLTDNLVTFGDTSVAISVPGINIQILSSSDSQINIGPPESAYQLVVSNPSLFIGKFIVTPEMTIPITTDSPGIRISILSSEATILSEIDSDISINISTVEAASIITAAEPSLFVGLFFESPEVNLPIMAYGDANIGIVPPEIQILSEIDYQNINITIVPSEAISEISADGSSVITFTTVGSTVHYLFTLTGTADGTTDIEIPISSFQCRMRSGSPTYLSAVVPNIDYADQIAARPNGKLQIELAYEQDGEYVQREVIVMAYLEVVRLDEGHTTKLTTLSGHMTATFVSKTVALQNVTDISTEGESFSIRIAEPNVYLTPGDIVLVDGEEYTADTIAYSMSVNSKIMEITGSPYIEGTTVVSTSGSNGWSYYINYEPGNIIG